MSMLVLILKVELEKESEKIMKDFKMTNENISG